MQRKPYVSTISAVLFSALLSGTAMTVQAESSTSSEHQTISASDHLQSNKLIGQTVKDKEGNDVGTIKNVLIKSDGNADYVVLSQAGGGPEYAVPWDKLSFTQNGSQVSLDAKKSEMSSEFSVFQPSGSSESANGKLGEDRSGSYKPGLYPNTRPMTPNVTDGGPGR